MYAIEMKRHAPAIKLGLYFSIWCLMREKIQSLLAFSQTSASMCNDDNLRYRSRNDRGETKIKSNPSKKRMLSSHFITFFLVILIYSSLVSKFIINWMDGEMGCSILAAINVIVTQYNKRSSLFIWFIESESTLSNIFIAKWVVIAV